MQRVLILGLASCLLAFGCTDDEGGDEQSTNASETGDGDGDGDPTGDGDGDPTGDGDGDPTGDGDGDPTGDGDGDPTGDGDGDPTGDGDGDPTGDGDGDPTGDGDGDPGSACDQQYNSCDALSAAFSAETLAVRSCTSASECGQVLQGTSCGCTRDWVARNDADTTCFYDLIMQAGPLQCDLGLASTCDCPGADGFDCIEGICTWNYL